MSVVPSIESSAQEVKASEDTSVKLPCHVSGAPKPQLEWFLNGVAISESDPRYMVNDDGHLSIFSVKALDEGSYKCLVQNTAGKAEKAVSLIVESNYLISVGIIYVNRFK